MYTLCATWLYYLYTTGHRTAVLKFNLKCDFLKRPERAWLNFNLIKSQKKKIAHIIEVYENKSVRRADVKNDEDFFFLEL